MRELQPFNENFSNINLIEAGAGTGKTFNITCLFFRYLIEQNLTVQQILVVTFTRAATGELKNRLLMNIQQAIRTLRSSDAGDDPFLKGLLNWVETSRISTTEAIANLERAERNFNKARIFTIHAFCNKVLHDEAFKSGFPFDAELIEGEQEKELVRETVDDYWRSLNESDESKKVLSEYLLGIYENPENLLDEIYPYLGKPYLQIVPENISMNQFKEVLEGYKIAFEELREKWNNERDTIWELMGAGILSRYKTYRDSRMRAMDDWLQTNFPPGKTPDQFEFFRQSVVDTKLKAAPKRQGTPAPQYSFFKLADEFITLQQKISNLKAAYVEPMLNKLRDMLRVKKESLEVFSYDDVLIRLRNALLRKNQGEELIEKLREAYPVALVDEFQDTDPIQYEIFKKIYADDKNGVKLFMVGDPKQAIYSFRGADVFVYMDARRDVKKANRFKLAHNYRSVPELLSGVNYLFQRFDDPFILKNIPYLPIEPGKDAGDYKYLKIDSMRFEPVQLWDIKPETVKSSNKTKLRAIIENTVAGEIKRLITLGKAGKAMIGEKPVEASHIAVLVRKHHQGEGIQQALMKQGIKSILMSKKSVFNTDEAYELQLLFKAIVDPGDERKISAALVTRLLGLSGEELMNLKDDEADRVQYINQFSAWNKMWQDHDFAFMFRSFLQQTEVAVRLMKEYVGERRVTNLYHLGELLQQYEQENHTGPHGLIRWLAASQRVEKTEDRELQLRLESDENQVIISTLHMSKGLEYPIVFCPYLWDSKDLENKHKPFIFHKKETKDSTAFLNAGGLPEEIEKNLFLKHREELAEEMRLAYVGMTRSQQCCYIPWVKHKNSVRSPLGVLLHGQQPAIHALKEKFCGTSENNIDIQPTSEVFDDIKSESSGIIGTEIPQWAGEGADTQSEDLPKLAAERWSGTNTLQSTNQVASFSYLSRQTTEDAEEPDYDQWIFEPEPAPEAGKELTMMNFPRGIEAGRCIHQIYEELNFGEPVKSGLNSLLIRESLEKYGFNLKWIKPLEKALSVSLNRPLLRENPAVKLSKLAKNHEQREIEFYFSMQGARTADLMEIIRRESVKTPVRANEGFMKGFIDLTFCFEGCYYILDYKSNHLGDHPDDYHPDKLSAVIKSHYYDLQYHIYSIAVHRFLSRRMAGYNYEKHFGGAIYLFLRGIKVEPDNFNGIYFDRPDFEVIQRLDNYLKEGNK